MKDDLTQNHERTIKQLLKTALLPVGSTMYVHGGGWNESDDGAGVSARTPGVSPKWKQFFEKQDAFYREEEHRSDRSLGLDCSGYIGWCICQFLCGAGRKEGYVMYSGRMAKAFSEFGWGIFREKEEVVDYRAGDIMSTPGHVWMAVGECEDRSVLLLHSSPPGVQLCGTPSLLKKENGSSAAVKMAEYYMKKCYPKWYEKYKAYAKDSRYLTDYQQMRWDVSGASMMTDPDGYRDMTAEKILEDVTGETFL